MKPTLSFYQVLFKISIFESAPIYLNLFYLLCLCCFVSIFPFSDILEPSYLVFFLNIMLRMLEKHYCNLKKV